MRPGSPKVSAGVSPLRRVSVGAHRPRLVASKSRSTPAAPRPWARKKDAAEAAREEGYLTQGIPRCCWRRVACGRSVSALVLLARAQARGSGPSAGREGGPWYAVRDGREAEEDGPGQRSAVKPSPARFQQ
jgi:hypothetical protein